MLIHLFIAKHYSRHCQGKLSGDGSLPSGILYASDGKSDKKGRDDRGYCQEPGIPSHWLFIPGSSQFNHWEEGIATLVSAYAYTNIHEYM